jgi:hypothetical protein
LEIALETGTPAYVLKNGRIVDIAEQHRRKNHAK